MAASPQPVCHSFMMISQAAGYIIHFEGKRGWLTAVGALVVAQPAIATATPRAISSRVVERDMLVLGFIERDSGPCCLPLTDLKVCNGIELARSEWRVEKDLAAASLLLSKT